MIIIIMIIILIGADSARLGNAVKIGQKLLWCSTSTSHGACGCGEESPEQQDSCCLPTCLSCGQKTREAIYLC